MDIKSFILSSFEDGSLTNKNIKQILKALEIPFREKERLQSILDDLCKDGEIFLLEDGTYGTASSLNLIQGKIVGNERGFGFLVPTDKEQYPNDFFIPHRNLNGALHGDTVLCKHVESDRSNDEAVVLKIVERGYKEIVGTFYRNRSNGYLIPDEKKYSENIYIPLGTCFNVPDGVKAVAKITSYPFGRSPGGEIVEILGDESSFEAEELSIIRSYSLREEFPANVLQEGERLEKRGIRPNDLLGRTDFRSGLIVTIDGEDTRDIDDAISLEKQGDNYLLGVHIADVTEYVKYLSPLDKEAYERGTSVYFPDRVLPMLPRSLSNGICSLNEGEDRLTLSCLMTIDEKGSIRAVSIEKGIIRSTHRMTYHQVSDILDGKQDVCNAFSDVVELLKNAETLARILKEKRNKQGVVELDVKEAHIQVDENGKITIPDFERPFSYEIIEQFMVTANECVAEYMTNLEMPFVYRIHEKPSEEKAENFRNFAQALGLNARFNAEDVKPYDYSKILKSAEDLTSFPVLNRIMLRSMQKARYSPVNVGHFGLASKCYCHFTSPIRRYPDLCIHRIIKEVLDGNYDTAVQKYSRFVSEASQKSSEAERTATEAERDMDDLYMTVYMSDHIGEEYDAVVSGVANFGVFCELKNTVEGFIPVETLEGTFEHIPEKFTLCGTKRSFTIGDEVKVKVVNVDYYERRTYFELLDK